MSGYREEDFENHVVRHLLVSGYRLCGAFDAAKNRLLLSESADEADVLARHPYDRDLVLIPEELLAFIRATQPDEYDRLRAQYGADTDRNIALRISREITRRGTLDVLRKDVQDRGVTLRLVYFRPASSLNPEHARLYRQNRFAVVRQLRFSRSSEKSLDLGLFVNGIPLFTAELKNSLTGQFVQNAIKQYKRDRDPREPLFQFKRCLAHFAVGNEEAFYTTRLSGGKTFFLPFNKGSEDGGAGNPVNPSGHQTAYLWEDVWQPDSLLSLLSDYLHLQKKTERVYDPKKDAVVEKNSTALIFPRYHQRDVVRRLVAASAKDGPGGSYLVQHSAGSGKSNSIAWLSHQLRQLYGPDGRRVFDTIIVVTDRRVLDQQLQRTIKQFEQVGGTVVPITETSAQLRKALEDGKDIVVTTLQKFPVISETIGTLDGQNFAVVIDEAHSSQSGESGKHLKKALGASLEEAEAEESDDAAPPDLEDIVAEAVRSEIRARQRQPHLSYYAFTATPKNKTLELFGQKQADGSFAPFHTYTMRQAIEEGFILDVLQHYTTFKRYFKLAKAAPNDEQYERSKAVRALTSYVDLTPHAVETKARICLDHFQRVTARSIQGKGRAMFVTRSRLHAVRYFLKFRALMREIGLPYAPLVAFSGTVKDPATGTEHTEASLNGLPPRVKIEDALKLPEYRLLVVANKFQTGFDEPLLHTMYVDKKLGGVAAVQTLSRLNRTTRGKTDPVVLDFANEADDIQEAFQRYYQQAALEEETDPNKLYDLVQKLDGFDLYTHADVDAFVTVFFDPDTDDELLQPILDRVVDRWKLRGLDEREDFRSTVHSFARLYGYVAQLVTFADVGLEKTYVFARNLARKLPPREGGGLPIGLTDAVDLDSFRIQQTYEGEIGLDPGDGTLDGISAETSGVTEPEYEYLSIIVGALNETHGIELTDKDRVRVEEIVREVQEDDAVQAVMAGDNSVANKRRKINKAVDERIVAQVRYSTELFQKLNDPKVKDVLKARLFDQLMTEFGSAPPPSA